MAKVSTEAKNRYFERVKEYKVVIDTILQREKNLLQIAAQDEANAPYIKLNLAEECLNLASYFVLLNDISINLLGIKNEAFLNDGRKACYKAIIYIEEVVTDLIDAPFSEYKDKLEGIENFSDEKRYLLCRKIGFAIQSVIDSFGDNTKWKWSFVELEGRFTTVVKNILNMKTLVAGLDPREEGYVSRVGHLNLVKNLLQKSADRYREKYELSTLRIDDFKKAIDYLQALKRIYIGLGDGGNAENIRKKAEVWAAKMEQDQKKMEERAGR